VETLVELHDVDLAYDRTAPTLAVAHLNLEVRRGEFAAVVGPSGCGKSTLMKLVTGLIPPTRGNVVVAGQDVDGPLKIVGMAFQNPSLLPWRSTLKNVLLPLEVTPPYRYEFRRKRAEFEARARSLLRAVGLGDFADLSPWQLSGGMQQRTSLCRALVHAPALLMLDEPFAALDAFTREELWDVLQDIWMKQGFTTILVTHDLREAVYLADTIHVMSTRPGRIVSRHTVDLERPRRPATSLQPEFADLVLRLREQIRQQLDGTGSIAAPQAARTSP
jgi:NitT/TauT family transport system ATP-binding protein